MMEKTDDQFISEFMEFEYRVSLGPFGGEYPQVRDTKQINYLEWSSPKWDQSFDWLIPVVKVIEKMVGVNKNVGNLLSMWTYYFHKFNGKISTDIKIAYALIVEFIKWYNTELEILKEAL